MLFGVQQQGLASWPVGHALLRLFRVLPGAGKLVMGWAGRGFGFTLGARLCRAVLSGCLQALCPCLQC